ncbi:hypothetical protein LEP1GSC193_3768 [Leptospira alstonii serovar Pingchang str. 80-412]|uniref:Uncharacterized protein n=2 Tax=Leptospira alstonii TaxID=28452 RepID=M6D1Z6_9LEPT|nr:hypothetical protein LEP1GSC194_2251 [Leptospira alstonii serovar Sichuan str. 79601]EQA80753.1 hypothetical protein LEP1GSC193_3768 [Leptospira alstonii serovar Pingchang str. 80-412]
MIRKNFKYYLRPKFFPNHFLSRNRFYESNRNQKRKLRILFSVQIPIS